MDFSPTALRTLRKERGLTRTTLAVRIGVSHDSVKAFERGKIRPSLRTLARLAEVLDVPMDAFFTDRSHAAA
ncbi:hypothetical protein GCM10010420_10860 [Streptomyces glaucosporus]|uniref:HTH cro/C1-type domain-containing protein n=1 Tax=Streptomyces glaucosporus TaxID=284044 RepID=A0ABN3HX27_9ACTN